MGAFAQPPLTPSLEAMNAGIIDSRRLLLLVLAVLGALPAYAHADFGPPQALSASDDGVTRADAVVGSDGVRTVAWYSGAGAGSVDFAKLAADGTVADSGSIAAAGAGEPDLVAEPGGDVLALWPSGKRLAFAAIHRSGSVGPVRSAPVDTIDFDAVADSKGVTHVAAVVPRHNLRVVQTFEIAPNGTPSAAREVSGRQSEAFNVQLGRERDGTLHVVWTQVNGGAGREVLATTIDRSGRNGKSPRTLFGGLVGAETVIGVHGETVVAERDWPKGDAIEIGRFSDAARDPKFEATSRIRLKGFESRGRTAFAPDGSGFVTWQGENGIGGAAVSKRGIAAHPHVISDASKVRSPVVAIDGGGSATVGWRGRGRSFSVVAVKPNGHPGKPEELAPESSQRILFGGSGAPLTALWISGEGSQLFAADGG